MHKVLIIDDEEDLLNMMSTAIKGRFEQVDVMRTSSSEGAFQGISQFSPDLIITDLVLPGTSGIEFIDRIKEVAPSVPIIAISGFPDEMVKLKQHQPEVNFLNKPFPLEKLNQILKPIFQPETEN